MNKLHALAASAMLVSCAIVAPAHATVLDFEDAPNGFTSYSKGGVTITAGGQVVSVSTSPNGTNGIFPNELPRRLFTATFDYLYTGEISVDLGDFGGYQDGLLLSLYSSSNLFLGSTSMRISETDQAMHTLSLSGTDVKYAIFGGVNPSANGNSLFADNFTFTSSAVPEPKSWVLLMLGFGTVGVMIRRRRPSVAKSRLA